MLPRYTQVLVMYTSVNVKQVTKYGSIIRKSCEVTLSLLYYPAGDGGETARLRELLANDQLRNATARYFANPVNYRAPQYPGLEAHLSSVNQLPVCTA